MLRSIYVLMFINTVSTDTLSPLSILRHGNSLHCMTSNGNETSAIAWDTGYSDVSYDYIKVSSLSKKWRFQNSQERELKFGPILDYRWERFPIQETCNYKLPQESFETTISIQGTETIYFCENKGVGECHKILFVVQDVIYKGREVRKECTKYNVHHNNRDWIHFTLSGNGTYFEIKFSGKTYTVNRQQYFGGYLVIDGKWKIHSLPAYSAVDQVDERIYLYEFLKTDDFLEGQNICLGLFVWVCKYCTLLLKLFQNGVESAGVTVAKKEEWEELKVCGNIKQGVTVEITVTTRVWMKTTPRFYIGDIIRKFSKSGVRIATLANVSDQKGIHCCYSIESKTKLCTDSFKNHLSDNNCPVSTIGVNCIPCQQIFNTTTCPSVPICDFISSQGVICSCPPNYDGESCLEKCHAGSFPSKCGTKCENCGGICNHMTDTCDVITKSNICCITVSNVSQTTALISWNKSNIEDNNLRYTVKYWLTNYRGCSSQYTRRKVENLVLGTENSIRLKGLIPYSNYNVEIILTNTSISMSLGKINVATLEAGELSEYEIPDISTTQNEAKVYINLNISNCTRIQGSVSYQVYLYCLSQWCSANSIIGNFSIQNSMPDITPVLSITGSTDYKVVVDIYRNSSHRSKEYNFRTIPTVPNLVRDVFYSVTDTSVELRWSPPYPPTGQLKEYEVTYWTDNPETAISRNFDAYSNYCSIWTKQIRARNEVPSDFGAYVDIIARTEMKDPSAPTNLIYVWNETANALILRWNHPDTPNGKIAYFQVCISELEINEKYEVNKEQFEYEYQIPYEKLNTILSDSIGVRVSVYNTVGFASANLNISTPPKLPKFRGNPNLTDITATSFKILIPAISNIHGNFSTLYVIITDTQSSATNFNGNASEQNILEKAKVKNESNSWIISTVPINQSSLNTSMEIKMQMLLNPGTIYEVTLLLQNEYRNISRYSRYTSKISIPVEQSFNLLWFLLIVPVICLIIFIWCKRKAKGSSKQLTLEEHTYEELLEVPSTNPNKARITNVQEEYSNKNDKNSKPIKVQHLENYVKQSLEDQELEKQYESFQVGQTKKWEYGMKSENKAKNRYKNVAAYDDTRVKLKVINDDPYSDYINANYIDGYDTKKTYIATQGPKSNTIDDFWRMIWENNVEYIVMIANIMEGGKKKVEKYWPDINETIIYADVTVTFFEINVFPEYEKKIFKISCKGKERDICHLHFTCWPDHGVPFYAQSLAPFLKRTLTISYGKSPIVVHCSAGIGRTGTFILCDVCLRMAAKTGEVDVYYQLRKLREQRINMVDNINQYKLVHLVLIHCLLAPDFSVQCTEKMEKDMKKITLPIKIAEQMRYIDATFWQDEAMRSVSAKIDTPIVPEKNRFQNILPDEYARIPLVPFPLSDGSSSYINAIKVDGFCVPFKFIVTQYPLSNTVGDFWRLIDQYDISVIICLNVLDLNDKTCCKFYPKSEESMQPTPYLAIECLDISKEKYYTISTINVNNSDKGNQERKIKLLQLDNWKYSLLHPANPAALLMTYEEMNSLGKTSNTILVACLDGNRASGLYTSLCCLVDKIKMEQVCDVCLAVRTVRHSRTEFVRESEQFSFLYECGLDYVQQFEMYSNFCSRKQQN